MKKIGKGLKKAGKALGNTILKGVMLMPFADEALQAARNLKEKAMERLGPIVDVVGPILVDVASEIGRGVRDAGTCRLLRFLNDKRLLSNTELHFRIHIFSSLEVPPNVNGYILTLLFGFWFYNFIMLNDSSGKRLNRIDL